MEIVVKIPDDMIKSLEQGSFGAKYDIYDLVGCLMNGTPLPDGAEILTKEAYSDLCARAAEQPGKRTEERTETHACDCISRQAAIKTLYTEIIKRRLLDDVNDGMLDEFDTESILRALTSVDPEIKTGKWIPIRFKSPQQGQRVFISTIKGTIHDEIWNMNCIHNYATDGCWYRNWFVVAWMPFTLKPYKMEDNI